MPHYIGIVFAFIALFGWGFGDFLIQRSSRILGDFVTLFYICFIGGVVITPFIWRELFTLGGNNLLLLSFLGVVILITALFDFEALKRGKIAVVVPVMSMELPFTVILSIVLANEDLSTAQILLIALSFIGIMLSITSSHIHEKLNKGMFEKGVILASIGSVGLALTNFLVGISSQRTSPLMAIWFSNIVISVFCLIYILYKKEERRLLLDMKKFPAMVCSLTVFDNSAWVAYAYATTIIPISIATTISESFVALAVLLGIFLNKEKLKPHQKVGIILCIVSVLLISYFSE